MKRPMVLAVLPVLVLGLSACSEGISLAEHDACNSMNAWNIGGRLPDRYDLMVASAQEALQESDRDELVAAAGGLAESTEAVRVADVTDFIALCSDLGWEPAEG